MYSIFDTVHANDLALFARNKGSKDKQKRKSRVSPLGVAAGAGIAGLAGAAGRYGGAEVSARRGSKYLDRPMDKMNAQGYLKARSAAESGGGAELFRRDMQNIKSMPGRAGSRAKEIYDATVNAVKNPKATMGAMGDAAKLRGGQALGLATSPKGLMALGGAAALAGGAYGASKLLGKKKKKPTLKEQLLGAMRR